MAVAPVEHFFYQEKKDKSDKDIREDVVAVELMNCFRYQVKEGTSHEGTC